LQQSIVAADDVVFQQLDDEAVLLNLASGAYFGLNAVGTRMWQLIGEHRSLGTVLDTLAREYEVDRGVLERDLLELVERLRTKGLVRTLP
jgi:hypothetical protein